MSVRKKILFLILFFFLIFLFIESIGFFVDYKFNLGVARFGVPMLVDSENVVKDPKLFWRFKSANVFKSRWEPAGEIKINQQGWRDDDFQIEKPRNLKRIALIGDSSTFGYRRRIEEIFANIIEKKLNDMQLNNVKWEVQNYGVPGYTIHQGWIVLNDYALQYNPDYVFILFGINDSRPSPVSDAEYKVNIISFEKYLQKLFSYKLLMSFYFKALERQKMRGFDTVRVPLDKYEEFIIEFNNNSKKNRFVFIPMTQPYRQEFANTPFAQNIKKYNQALRNVCLQNNIEFIDLENEFNNYYLKNKRDLIWDACHPDAEGNIFISELMFEKIKAIDQKARN